MLHELASNFGDRLGTVLRTVHVEKPFSSYKIHRFREGNRYIPKVRIRSEDLAILPKDPELLLKSLRWSPAIGQPYCDNAEIRWDTLLQNTSFERDQYTRIVSMRVYLADREKNIWLDLGLHTICIKDKIDLIENEHTGLTMVGEHVLLTSGVFESNHEHFVLVARPWYNLKPHQREWILRLLA